MDNEYEMVADVQIGQINLDALPTYKVTAEEDDTEETGRKKRKDMLAICIGKQEKGVSYIATKTINDGIPPPSFSPKLRTAQRRLFNAIAPELSQFIFHDNISAIEDWVRMDVLSSMILYLLSFLACMLYLASATNSSTTYVTKLTGT